MRDEEKDYLLATSQLNEVFDPVIYNAMNKKTVTWNLLMKKPSAKAKETFKDKIKEKINNFREWLAYKIGPDEMFEQW